MTVKIARDKEIIWEYISRSPGQSGLPEIYGLTVFLPVGTCNPAGYTEWAALDK